MFIVNSSLWRAWVFLVWLSFVRQARAHLMVWIALGLLGLSLLIVSINTQAGRWTVSHWSYPRGKGPTIGQHVANLGYAELLPWQGPDASVVALVNAGYRTAVYHGTGFYLFSEWIVFSLFTTFLLPIWSVSFASEGLGREREAQNLLWVLTRPIPRPAIFLAKYVALLPWCLALNFGGFTLLCVAGGHVGMQAFDAYWPAVLWGTLAFSAVFHALAVVFRRAAIVALLYAFFLETIMGNMPGQFKRLSISFYTRCLMYNPDLGVQPARPEIFLPVSGTTACLVLAAVTGISLIVGAILFTRNEYLDVS